MKILTILSSIIVFSIVVSRPYAEPPKVVASWYGEAFRGNLCADGKTIFNPDDPKLAAHKTLPFGTKVKVSITKTKFIVVTIVDRGPFVAGRSIDLSKAGFSKLADTRAGLVKVTLEVLSSPNP